MLRKPGAEFPAVLIRELLLGKARGQKPDNRRATSDLRNGAETFFELQTEFAIVILQFVPASPLLSPFNRPYSNFEFAKTLLALVAVRRLDIGAGAMADVILRVEGHLCHVQLGSRRVLVGWLIPARCLLIWLRSPQRSASVPSNGSATGGRAFWHAAHSVPAEPR